MRQGIIVVLDQLNIPLGEERKEQFAAVCQALFDGLTLQSTADTSAFSYDTLSFGVQLLIGGKTNHNGKEA